MALPTVAQLTEVSTAEGMTAYLIDAMQTAYAASGVEVDLTSLQDDSAARADIWASAVFFADRTRVTANIVRGNFLATATGDWLTARAKSDYDVTRNAARKTVGTMELTPDDTAALPQTLTAGSLVVRHASSGATYRNTASVSLTTANVAVSFDVQAEVAGAFTVIPPSQTLELVTPIPGVSVTNASPGWITTEGADEETDPALRTRCWSRWATLAIASGPRDAYVYWAQQADPAVTRVQVDDQDPTGTGQVGVYVASSTGAPQASTVAAVDAYINGAASPYQPKRHPIGATVSVYGATPVTVTLDGTIYVDGQYYDTILADLESAYTEYFSLLPVGGTKTDNLGSDGYVLLGDLYRVAFSQTGVRNIVFSTVGGDVTLSPGEVAVLSFDSFSLVAL